MRIVDAVLAFPGLILAIVIAGLFKPGILPVMIGLVSVWWVAYSRIIRGMVLALRERPFIEGARAIGASDIRIIRRHILPHILPPIIVLDEPVDGRVDPGDLGAELPRSGRPTTHAGVGGHAQRRARLLLVRAAHDPDPWVRHQHRCPRFEPHR